MDDKNKEKGSRIKSDGEWNEERTIFHHQQRARGSGGVSSFGRWEYIMMAKDIQQQLVFPFIGV